jgi:hypothetical protein
MEDVGSDARENARMCKQGANVQPAAHEGDNDCESLWSSRRNRPDDLLIGTEHGDVDILGHSRDEVRETSLGAADLWAVGIDNDSQWPSVAFECPIDANASRADPGLLFTSTSAAPNERGSECGCCSAHTSDGAEPSAEGDCEACAADSRLGLAEPDFEAHDTKVSPVSGDGVLEDVLIATVQPWIEPRLLERRDLAAQHGVTLRRQAALANAIQRQRLVDTANPRAPEHESDPTLPVGRPQNVLVKPA